MQTTEPVPTDQMISPHVRRGNPTAYEVAGVGLGVLAVIGCAVAIGLTSAPIAPLGRYIIWTITLATAINLGIVFEGGDANFAAMMIMAAFLSMGFGPTTVVVATGVLLGEATRIIFHRWLDYVPRSLRHTLITASVNLSIHVWGLLAGGAIYLALRGPLPIVQPSGTGWTSVNLQTAALPLAGLFVGYLVVSYGLFGLYSKFEGQSVRREVLSHWRIFATLEVVPMFFSILIASVSLNMPSPVFGGFCIFLIVGMLLTHNLSRARARLEQRVRELGSLSTVGQAVANSLELPAVLDAIHRQTQQLMDARYFYVALYDGDSQRLIFPLAYEHDVLTRYDSRPFGQGLTEHVINSRKPVLIKHDVRGYAAQLGIALTGPVAQSWLGVPIVFGDEVLGVITVQNLEQPDRYNEANRDILAAIAAQAATAIHTAQMFSTVRQHTDNLAVLNTVSMAINSTLDLDRVLHIIVNSVGRLMGNQKAAVFLTDETGTRATLAAWHQLSPAYVAASRELTAGPQERARVITNRQPLIVDDLQLDERLPNFRVHADEEGFRAFADMPLQTQARAIGILTIYYAAPHRFTLAEIDLLNTFANQAASAIVNAKRYGRANQALTRRVEQLAALQQIGRELSSSLDMNLVLQQVLDRAMESTGANYGSIGLYQPDRQIARFSATRGFSPERDREIRQNEWPVERGLMGRALRTGETVNVPDVSQVPEYYPVTADVRSQLTVPIKINERILGVINLESMEINRFEAAEDFVIQLATQAAIALQNAQLFARVAAGRDQLQAILDSSPTGILMFDAATRIVLVNPQLEIMWAITRAQLEGQTLLTLIDHPDLQIAAKIGYPLEELLTLLQQFNQTPPPVVSKDVFPMPHVAGPDRFVERTWTPVLNAAGQPFGWMLVLRDVTEERELQQLRDDLTHMIIHDLRSPLASIQGSLSLLGESLGDQPSDSFEQQILSISHRSAQRLLNLVNSLLDISRLTSGQAIVTLRPTLMTTLIDNVVENLSPLALDANVTLRTNLPPDLPPVLIDDEKIGRVLINLLDNALKFTPPGGQINVSAERWSEDEHFVCCHIRDTGPGIPAEYRARIFERFVQIPAQAGRRRGSGLGLSFCQLAVEAHGGRIWADEPPPLNGAPSTGSEFSFTVTVADPKQLQESAKTSGDQEITG